MQSQNKTKTLTQNNIRRSSRRRSQNPQAQQTMRASSGSCRIHRKELWFEINSTGTGRYVFQYGNYPLWFEKLSQVFESYEMHSVRIHWISGYSQFAGGSTFMSYNVNEAQKDAPFTVSSIFAQQNSGKSRLAENSSFAIPASSWRRTPNRRMCSGAGSYLFDLRYAIQTSEDPSPITVWIEYDVTFHTPQIESIDQPITPGENYLLTWCGGEVLSNPQSVTAEGNCTWTVEGSFTSFMYTAGSLTSTTGDRDGGAITITYEDDTTATVISTFQSSYYAPRYTFTGITGTELSTGTTLTSPTSSVSPPSKFYLDEKKIKKIQVVVSASSPTTFVIVPITN